ncbi:hypothetical protein QJS10_CPB19g01603 [Acorus calamus]|uniref:NADP-dependent oxidoreductase domain-containing protein n=1 Tax=Acorus calamus TaxID=4465 RepID=A0AAV9CK16_ACOCL|nr:hypothetical protein QJS10_CPB19g01603 [Acorus calamus]
MGGGAGVTEIILNSGHKMPVMGMGTASYPYPDPETVESAVLEAISLGYRHFDTASAYRTERPLGRAISTAIQNGLINGRDDVFVTTKLWCGDADRDLVVPALKESLRALGMEYVDLYLIHFPGRVKKSEGENGLIFSKEDILQFDMRGTWEGMEECHRLGLARSIGVSNFSCKKLQLLLSHAVIPPAVNQVEMHPIWQQRKLRKLCSELGIHVSAYSPLGAGGALWGSTMVLESIEIKHIAEAKGKTPAQVCLRWAFEQGVSFLPKSFNKGRLKENMEIFDWKLDDEDLEKLNHIPQQRITIAEIHVSPNGPYQSIEDIWDGEL